MDRKEIMELISILEQSSLSVLELQQGEFRIRMEKPVGMALTGTAHNHAAPIEASAPMPVVDIPPVHPPVTPELPVSGAKEIRAPMVGIYHDAPGGAVLSGHAAKKGEVVCVIEAMKLMNEIVIEEDGVIAWSALKDGDMVEYDQLLFTYN